jgi:hypothetical protein
MNFSPKLIAASAILLGSTLVTAAGLIREQAATTIDFQVTMDVVANIEVQSKSLTSAQLLGASITPELAGFVVVETNMNPWDVAINSANGGKLKSAAGKTVQYMQGAVKTDAKLQIYVSQCAGAITSTVGLVSTTCPLVATQKINTFATGTAVVATNALGTAPGFGFTNVDGSGFHEGVANVHGANGTALIGGGDPAPYAYFAIYANLVRTDNTTGIGAGDIVADVTPGTSNTFEEKLTFTLISKY